VHEGLDLGEGLLGQGTDPLVAIRQNLAQIARVGRDLTPPGPDRAQPLVQRLGEQPLQRRGAATAQPGGDVLRAGLQAQRGQPHQVGHGRPGFRLVGDGALVIGPGRADQSRRLVVAGGQRDGIAPALAHLLAVGPEQQRDVTEQGVRGGEVRPARTVAIVEAAGDGPGQFQVRKLVLADRNQVGVAAQDVGGLVDRVSEHQRAHR
jgi:hypothetical protein